MHLTKSLCMPLAVGEYYASLMLVLHTNSAMCIVSKKSVNNA